MLSEASDLTDKLSEGERSTRAQWPKRYIRPLLNIVYDAG